MERLDIYDDLPKGLRSYLSANGWHFNKPLCEWAVSHMRDTNGQKPSMTEKAVVEETLSRYGITPERAKGYDCVYVWHMLRSDFGDIVEPDDRLALAVKRYIDDPDGYDGIAMTRFHADCIAKGTPVDWHDVL